MMAKRRRLVRGWKRRGQWQQQLHRRKQRTWQQGNSDRDEERAKATAKGNGMLTAMAMATATKRAY
jgi:hypothetical protein